MAGLLGRFRTIGSFSLLMLAGCCAIRVAAQTSSPSGTQAQSSPSQFRGETTQDYNQRLPQLAGQSISARKNSAAQDYRSGPEDLLDISVFEAPDLNRTVRVSADGDISPSLLGTVHAAGLTSRELEIVLEELPRRTYMRIRT